MVAEGVDDDTGGVSDAPVLKPDPREKTFLFRVLASVVIPLMRILGKYTIIGGENVPPRASCVIAPNHYSEIDPLVIAVAIWQLGRPPRFLGKASLFRLPIVGAALRRTGQIPVERGGGGNPLGSAKQLSSEGHVVIIYPEGSLTRDPELWPMRGKTGAVRMALETGLPLIPAAHWGTQKIMARYGKGISFFPPRKPVSIVFGEPMDLSKYQGQPMTATLLAEATDELMVEISSLLGGLRGETPPAERWDPARQGQAETGRFD